MSNNFDNLELRIAKKEDYDIIPQFHKYKPTIKFMGRRIDYAIFLNNEQIGFIGAGSSIMAIKPRDDFIGWKKEQRLKHLVNTANNWRFTLKPNLPKNTGSKVISLFIKTLRNDWKNKYGNELVFLETLVEPPFTGNVYIASGWIKVGMTKGLQFQWKNPSGILPDDVVMQKFCKFGDKIDYNRWKVISGKSKSKIILVKPINHRWKKILMGEMNKNVPKVL